jgi:light-regulated signal transduction histidine kinase (bacteriophytochrome)
MTPTHRLTQPLDLHESKAARVPGSTVGGRAGRVIMLEREIEALSARVEALEREKAQMESFAAVAAHELVEPLVMTEAYASIISDRLSGSEHDGSRSDLQTVGRSMARLRLLVESVLHEARSRTHPIERRQVRVNALVADCLALLQPEIDSREARVVVGELPNATADGPLLGGVFGNLLINALKYSPRRGAMITLGGAVELGRHRYWVDSEGPVIPTDDRTRIFTSFQRGRDERRANGAGLGLSICHRIVTRHGGEIGVEPLGDEGNRFYFTLPS